METLERGLERRESVAKRKFQRDNSGDQPQVSDIHIRAQTDVRFFPLLYNPMSYDITVVSSIRKLRCTLREFTDSTNTCRVSS